MTTDICLPRVSPDDAAVTLVKWHVDVGSRVAPGDVIAEIESDKAIVELEAEESGVITEIRVPEGSDDVHADQVLAVLDASAADSAAPAQATTEGHPSDAGGAAPADDARAPDLVESATEATEPGTPRAGNGGDPGASTLATRMARQAGVSLDSLSGSGADGRILADDVRAAAGLAPRVRSAHPPQPLPVDGDTAFHGGFEPEFDIQTPDNMRRIIAERLAESKRRAPHFYMSLDCRADALLSLRKTLKEGGAEISLNDLILKVTAVTLKRVPALNAAWSDAGIRHFRSVDLAVAVAIEGGLITPVIREADRKRLVQIAAEMRDLVTRARAGQLSREEYSGGTFTVSNMGMYGIDRFTAVINPPQAAILAVAAVGERPVVENGAVVTANMMTCSLSVDHRVTDGVAGAEFLQTFKRLAEDPRLLLL
ncbi:MAG: pyruvate dehydrogenase complex dihydrolipoamide acetyltransferase [Gammaproteobacteria bacterium]|nr:pyruvate dehydrogenase complex dihydrolipoamide acetyltransferase [Gammaproteobacteria bacterium]NIM71773.1 pyruvate dehydrogenase complex dihydrolipoamide acetyltransferase [Gammaproteobacteria bacterium]NIN37869.1 pyruvate dehydrogenase complex dihydrolipoamide acetyltransferase [Gammaproteobacteria bacterium]NIO23529.1 pyruvate dehydrogenase complex dihydrolipoamide acetyltransferase [Gammaproteobacteria bacterium]NIO64145.1 pyruvate dehydrogenase complex dihydrolipoamide acetyltransferas